MTSTDWLDWHTSYEEEASPLSRRLKSVQRAIRAHLAARDDQPVRAISACAGQGRDLLEVLATHPGRGEVAARLVELDHRNVAIARAAAKVNGLTGVEVVEGDAGVTDSYAGAVPADLVLFCGVFGNITDSDIETTIHALPQFCTPGASVIWTRGRPDHAGGEESVSKPDLLPSIHKWFTEAGFEQVSLDTPEDVTWSVGVHRLTAEPKPLLTGRRLFTFIR
ncbi:MAG TPA: class I SAM-dependent methyltransferase family protein [Kribbella sp.]|uniref:class I SAM-dependent methyltransferase family protein n=1 Tax=Kribbella sp. TaxID=1871183 RepID=UPI002D7A1132|nr:class I SAM-dependent methyltransferase family protein [Kribbella sp.]HET6297626.1 class I SAM-dependent methyltransferase family protein [Kribbella sp.]